MLPCVCTTGTQGKERYERFSCDLWGGDRLHNEEGLSLSSPHHISYRENHPSVRMWCINRKTLLAGGLGELPHPRSPPPAPLGSAGRSTQAQQFDKASRTHRPCQWCSSEQSHAAALLHRSQGCRIHPLPLSSQPLCEHPSRQGPRARL